MNKFKMLALILAAATALSACSGTDRPRSSNGGTHAMGSPKDRTYMSDRDMPQRGRGHAPQTTTEGQHEMGSPKNRNYMSNDTMPKRN